MKTPPGCDDLGGVLYQVSLLVFQGGDWDDVYCYIAKLLCYLIAELKW